MEAVAVAMDTKHHPSEWSAACQAQRDKERRGLGGKEDQILNPIRSLSLSAPVSVSVA